MKVEKGTMAQLQQLIAVRLEFLKELNFLSFEDEENIRQKLTVFFTSHLDKDLFCYVMKKGGQIISSVFVLISEKLPTNTSGEGYFGTLLNVYTRPEYRKQGFAREILNEVIQDSNRNNLDLLVLSATESGYALYEQVGFKVKKEKYLQMERPLGDL